MKKPKPEKVPKQRVTLKQNILEAAARLFVQYGYEDTTVQMIADTAGVVVGSVTYHFKNKYMLLHDLLTGLIQLQSSYVREILPDDSSAYLFHCVRYIYFYRELMKNEQHWRLWYQKDMLNFWNVDKVSLVEDMYREISADFHKGMSEDAISMAAYMDLGARIRLYEEFARGNKLFTIHNYCYCHILLIGQLAGLDEATIQRHITQAFEFADNHTPPNMPLFHGFPTI